jgi:hypothetical protein
VYDPLPDAFVLMLYVSPAPSGRVSLTDRVTFGRKPDALRV